MRELGDGRGLPRPVDADCEVYRGPLGGRAQARVAVPGEYLRKLVLQALTNILCLGEAFLACYPAQVVHDPCGRMYVHIGLDQRFLELVEQLVIHSYPAGEQLINLLE